MLSNALGLDRPRPGHYVDMTVLERTTLLIDLDSDEGTPYLDPIGLHAWRGQRPFFVSWLMRAN